MKKMNEYTRRFVEIEEVENIWRTSDDCLYTVYKDEDGNYYMDAYDAAPSVAELNGTFASDEEAVEYAQKLIDKAEEKKMKRYAVEFLEQESGCWISATDDCIEAGSKEEAMEYALDWVRDRIVDNAADDEERDAKLAEMDEITYRVREVRGWDEEADAWILRSELA